MTATITNGAAESSPYSKSFDITAYVGNDTADGTWKRGEDTLVKNGNNWSIYLSSYNFTATGIITLIEGSKAHTQINGTVSTSGFSGSGYTYASGIYNLSGNTLMLSNSGLANGTWTKQP